MSTPVALFSFLIEATAPQASNKYIAGQRYELIVFVREHSIDEAKAIARKEILQACWQFPEVKKVIQVDGKVRLAKFRNVSLEEAIRSAAKHGCAIVVFDRPAA